jgi:hypothetical protein
MCRPVIGAVIILLIVASTSLAERGDIVAHFTGVRAHSFVEHPTLGYTYATLPGQQQLAIINTQAHQIVQTISIGLSPQGMSISSDGSELYIARHDSIAVFDTASRTIARTFIMPDVVNDVVVGPGNKLWVLSLSGVFPIDRTSGAIVGATLPVSHFPGRLEISPDRNTLYYGQFDITGSRLFKVDVSIEPAVVLWGSPDNGADLTLSHDGSFIAYDTPLPSGNGFARRRTSDMAITGYFDVGAWGARIAFSPDDAKAYLARPRFQGEWIDVIDTVTLAVESPFQIVGEPYEMWADRTGRWLFVSYRSGPNNSEGTYIIDTGRIVPEPATFGLVAALLLGMRRRAFRSRRR